MAVITKCTISIEYKTFFFSLKNILFETLKGLHGKVLIDQLLSTIFSGFIPCFSSVTEVHSFVNICCPLTLLKGK